MKQAFTTLPTVSWNSKIIHLNLSQPTTTINARFFVESTPYDFATQSGVCRNIAYVSILADRLADRHQIVVKAPTEAELIGKLFDNHGLLPCPKKPGIFRKPAECDRIRAKMKAEVIAIKPIRNAIPKQPNTA